MPVTTRSEKVTPSFPVDDGIIRGLAERAAKKANLKAGQEAEGYWTRD